MNCSIRLLTAIFEFICDLAFYWYQLFIWWIFRSSQW